MQTPSVQFLLHANPQVSRAAFVNESKHIVHTSKLKQATAAAYSCTNKCVALEELDVHHLLECNVQQDSSISYGGSLTKHANPI